MRFFLEFVSCYGRSFKLAEDSRIGEAEEEIAERPQRLIDSEESRRQRRRKRGRAGFTAVAPWKPSLYAITEGRIVAEEGGEKSELKAERVVKRKSSGGSRSKVHLRSYHDDYRQNSVETIVPVFSAAPFMF